MNSALSFLLSALALVVVVLTVIAMSFWRGAQLGARAAQQAQDGVDDPVQANAAVYKDQLSDLEKEYMLV